MHPCLATSRTRQAFAQPARYHSPCQRKHAKKPAIYRHQNRQQSVPQGLPCKDLTHSDKTLSRTTFHAREWAETLTIRHSSPRQQNLLCLILMLLQMRTTFDRPRHRYPPIMEREGEESSALCVRNILCLAKGLVGNTEIVGLIFLGFDAVFGTVF